MVSPIRTTSTSSVPRNRYEDFVQLWESGVQSTPELARRLKCPCVLVQRYKTEYLIQLANAFCKNVNE